MASFHINFIFQTTSQLTGLSLLEIWKITTDILGNNGIDLCASIRAEHLMQFKQAHFHRIQSIFKFIYTLSN